MPAGMVPGLLEMNPGFRDARGYALGYDTQQMPFDVAKQRGLAGVVGGVADQLTGGMTDFDKRGDSKKQKDAKNFLNKFIFGTQGDMARKTRDEMEGGNITSFSPGPRPELGEFDMTFDTSKRAQSADFMRSLMAAQANNVSEKAKSADFMRNMMAAQANNAGLQQQRR
tara:strand:- start:295 stop:801 length:507 start_codon:yes stop_codon:yes gene_type:complete